MNRRATARRDNDEVLGLLAAGCFLGIVIVLALEALLF